MATSNNDIYSVVFLLKLGTDLWKYKKNGRRYFRRYYIDRNETCILYQGSHRVFSKKATYETILSLYAIDRIDDIDEIRIGFRTETFNLLREKLNILRHSEEEYAFSIIYDNHRKAIDLVALDTNTRDMWVNCLLLLKAHCHRQFQYDPRLTRNWIVDLCYSTNDDYSKPLSKSECRSLLTKRLNVEMPDDEFEDNFTKAAKTNKQHLTQEELIEFFTLITARHDLYDIMKRYVGNQCSYKIYEIYMTENDLSNFLGEYENEDVYTIKTASSWQQFLEKFEPNFKFRNQNRLSVDGFRNMLLSQTFDITESSNCRKIWQNMNRPLCDYYISTSHNTYLFYNQLCGESNPEAYNRALLTGCKALEFDCYDGDDGQPIVTHGLTLVKPCSFETIIRHIKPNLFKISPYPVIFNIENHCSPSQQRELVRILKTHLGDHLATRPASKQLQSPEDLREKVLIRSKYSSSKIESDENDEFKFDEKVVYFKNARYRGYNYAKEKYSPFHSSSLAESDLINHARTQGIDLILETMTRVLRSYPSGTKQDSSNPNPVSAWNVGIQMVALNFQTDDDYMALYYGKFLDNGACGYILKPKCLIDLSHILLNSQFYDIESDYHLTVTINIISGQLSPRSHEKSTDIPNPFVVISTHGMKCDENVYKTKYVSINRFYPIWNEKFTFEIKHPDMCLIYFRVMDHGSLSFSDRLGYFSAPITMIQTGYRHIHLKANNNDQTHSTLFVHVSMKNCKNIHDSYGTHI